VKKYIFSWMDNLGDLIASLQPTNWQFIFRNIQTKIAMRTLQTAAEGYQRSHAAQRTGRLCNKVIIRRNLYRLVSKTVKGILCGFHFNWGRIGNHLCWVEWSCDWWRHATIWRTGSDIMLHTYYYIIIPACHRVISGDSLILCCTQGRKMASKNLAF